VFSIQPITSSHHDNRFQKIHGLQLVERLIFMEAS
jgi:hypothetical protein